MNLPANRRGRPWVLLLLGLLLVALTACGSSPQPKPTAAARTYHLDCSAPVSGAGTATAPWNSLQAVARHGVFKPGETIALRRGTVCHGQLAPRGSGTNGHPITITAWGMGPAPLVSGDGTPDQTGAVQLSDVHDWVVQDIAVSNTAPQGVDNTQRAGILVLNDSLNQLSRITIRGTTVRAVTSSPYSFTADSHSFGGIAVVARTAAGRSTTAFSDVQIDDNVVDHVGRSGIVVWGGGWPKTLIRDVALLRNRVTDAEGDSILLLGVEKGLIEHNVSVGGGHLPSCPACTPHEVNTANAGIWPTRSRSILIRYNEVSGEGAAGGDGEGFDIDEYTDDVVLEGNYSHDNEGGGVLLCGARNASVRFNVLENNGIGAITFACAHQYEGLQISNNEIRVPAGSTAAVLQRQMGTSTASILFADNLVVNGGSGGYSWPGLLTSTGNGFSGTHPSTQPAGAGDADVESDDGFGSSGSTGLDSVLSEVPLPRSVLAGSGVPLSDSGPLDYFGTRVPATFADRGAFAIGRLPSVAPGVEHLRARVHGHEVHLSWSAQDGSTFTVWRRTAGNRRFEQVFEGAISSSWVDSEVPAGISSYRVSVRSRDGSGPASRRVVVTVPSG